MTEIFKAHRLIRDVPVPDLHLVATVEMPSTLNALWSEANAFKQHDEQGQRIVEALLASLPGGTVDAVLRHLLLKKASLLVVTL